MSNAGQFAAIIMAARAQHDDALAIQALVRAGFRIAATITDLDEALRLAVEWSRPSERRAA